MRRQSAVYALLVLAICLLTVPPVRGEAQKQQPYRPPPPVYKPPPPAYKPPPPAYKPPPRPATPNGRPSTPSGGAKTQASSQRIQARRVQQQQRQQARLQPQTRILQRKPGDPVNGRRYSVMLNGRRQNVIVPPMPQAQRAAMRSRIAQVRTRLTASRLSQTKGQLAAAGGAGKPPGGGGGEIPPPGKVSGASVPPAKTAYGTNPRTRLQASTALSTRAPLTRIAIPTNQARQTVASWYSRAPYVKKESVDSLVKGTDFQKPVFVRKLQRGERVVVWVRQGTPAGPGMHFTNPGTDPKTLGIETKGRVQLNYVVSQELEVLETTARDFTEGQVSGVGGKGGGQQLIMPRDWQSRLRQVEK